MGAEMCIRDRQFIMSTDGSERLPNRIAVNVSLWRPAAVYVTLQSFSTFFPSVRTTDTYIDRCVCCRAAQDASVSAIVHMLKTAMWKHVFLLLHPEVKRSLKTRARTDTAGRVTRGVRGNTHVIIDVSWCRSFGSSSVRCKYMCALLCCFLLHSSLG